MVHGHPESPFLEGFGIDLHVNCPHKDFTQWSLRLVRAITRHVRGNTTRVIGMWGGLEVEGLLHVHKNTYSSFLFLVAMASNLLVMAST